MRAFVVVLTLSFSVQASAQTLADAARRERLRQKQVEHLNKGVYTNSTPIVPRSGTPATPAVPAPTAAPAPPAGSAPANTSAQASPKPTGPVDNQGRDEKYWREEFQKARDAVRRADEKVQILEVRVTDLNTQLLRQSDVYNRENVIGPQITAAQKELEATRREAEQARRRISELEDQLRTSGGLPGWAR
jgi:hypothetical protein